MTTHGRSTCLPASVSKSHQVYQSGFFYIYYYNPYPDDITFKHEEMTGWEDDPDHTFNPTSDNAAFMKYVEVGQLYEHGGVPING